MPEHWLFAVVVGIAIIMGFSFSSWNLWREDRLRLSITIDLALVSLFGGLVGARLVSVALDAQSFLDYPQDTIRIWYGGLDWHGAVFGSLFGAWLWARWQQVDFSAWLDAVALVLPFVFMAVWLAGREIGYGQGIISEDLPEIFVGFLPGHNGIIERRIEVQLAGILLGLVQLWLVVCLTLLGKAENKRFWIVLGVISISMLLLGPLMEQEFRWWLDLVVLAPAIKNSLASRHRRGSKQNVSTNS